MGIINKIKEAFSDEPNYKELPSNYPAPMRFDSLRWKPDQSLETLTTFNDGVGVDEYDVRNLGENQLLVIYGRHNSAYYKVQKVPVGRSQFAIRMWGKSPTAYITDPIDNDDPRSFHLYAKSHPLYDTHEYNGTSISQNSYPYFETDDYGRQYTKNRITSDGYLAWGEYWMDGNQVMEVYNHFETKPLEVPLGVKIKEGIADTIRKLTRR